MAKLSFHRWLNLVIGICIQGGAVSAGSVFGCAAASAAGLPITPLELNQLLAIFISGGLVKLLMFLQKQPVPNWDGWDTDYTKKKRADNEDENDR